MLRRLLLVAALLAPAVLAPAARAATLTDTAGPVTATVTFAKVSDYEFADLRIAITRAGAAAYDQPVDIPDCSDGFCRPTAVTVRDLRGDGEPEVLVDVFTGGAHCCTSTQILRWDGAAYRATTRAWGDVGYALRDLNHDGVTEFRSADDRFAYAFAAYAFSGFPLQVLHLGADGRFTDVTRHFGKALRRDARRQRREYRALRRDDTSLGFAAAWAADEYNLGHRRRALRFLRAELRHGRLQGQPGWPRRGPFIRVLKRRLRTWGY